MMCSLHEQILFIPKTLILRPDSVDKKIYISKKYTFYENWNFEPLELIDPVKPIKGTYIILQTVNKREQFTSFHFSRIRGKALCTTKETQKKKWHVACPS